jgi:regulator of sirC expression with transglutaminase-like and TPR domain
MNELLLSEIASEDKDLLQTFMLIEETIFHSNSEQEQRVRNDINHDLDCLDDIINQCQIVVDEIASPIERAESLLNELFYKHLFADIYHPVWPVASYTMVSGISQRLMAPALKAVVIQEIITACGFDVDIVYVPHQIMLRITCDEQYAIIFDPVNGESLNWHELENRLDDLEGDPSQQALDTMPKESILTEHLHSLKNTLMRTQQFDKALKCVDLLLSLKPNDPLQRRDRGFLLHQLDCFKVAVDDYKYFVEKCPKDPTAQILKAQLKKINLTETVFH